MPTVQSTYTTQSAARVGMIASGEDMSVLISGTVETAAGVGFGVAVQFGATNDGVKAVGDGSATAYRGVTVRDLSRNASGNVNGFEQYSTARLMLKGVIYVTAPAAITRGQAAYYDAAGVITNVSTSNTAIPNAYFDESAASGALVKLRLN